MNSKGNKGVLLHAYRANGKKNLSQNSTHHFEPEKYRLQNLHVMTICV